MLRARSHLHAFIMLFMLGFGSPAFAAITGQPAPGFTATDALSGEPLNLGDLRGLPIVLEWNNFDCPFVRKHYGAGAMQALQRAAIKNGAVWVMVNSSAAGKQGYLADSPAVKAALAAHKAAPSYYLLDHDGAIGRAFGAKTTPHMFVIDAEGMLAYQGAIDSNASADPADITGATNYVAAALTALKKGAAVRPAATQPYGCGVKYGY